MNIKDYLHLYLGAKINTSLSGTILTGYWYDRIISGECDAQLILTRLSDMGEFTCRFFYELYFDKQYAEDWSGDNGSVNFRPKRINPTYEHIQRIIEGKDYASDSFQKVVEITKWLLDLHFDLFGLIEAGLAIDKNKLK